MVLSLFIISFLKLTLQCKILVYVLNRINDYIFSSVKLLSILECKIWLPLTDLKA